MEKWTREFWLSIECIPGCANCCPKHCRYLTENNLCRVHPKVLNVTPGEAFLFGRGQKCHIPPIEVFTWAVYCPAVARVFEEVGIFFPHYTTREGVEMLSGSRGVMAETRRLRGFNDDFVGAKRDHRPFRGLFGVSFTSFLNRFVYTINR